MAFLVVSSALWANKRWHVTAGTKAVFVGTMIVLWAVTIYSRLHLYYHTLAQVLVGSGVGASLGAAFHVALERWGIPHVFPWIMRHPVATAIMLKDTTLVHNVLRVEHEAYEAARRAVQGKRGSGSGCDASGPGQWQDSHP